jgi:hypothetical protein
LDFTVYRRVPPLTMEESDACSKANRPHPPTREEPSPLVLDEVCKQRILDIGLLHSITIYDKRYMCRLYMHSSLAAALEDPSRCWFVHYCRSDWPMMVGAGNVIVMEKGTGKVFYDGNDGME